MFIPNAWPAIIPIPSPPFLLRTTSQDRKNPIADDSRTDYRTGDLTIISDIDRKDRWHVAKVLNTDDTSGEPSISVRTTTALHMS